MSNYLSVSSLTKYLKLKFDKDPYLERVYLTGQVSNFRKRPNHQYFSLKDEKAVIQATVWAGIYKSKWRRDSRYYHNGEPSFSWCGHRALPDQGSG